MEIIRIGNVELSPDEAEKLYYSGEKYAFVALLPEKGTSVADMLSSLDGAALQALLASAEDRPVEAAIPKFESEYETDLAAVLAKLGITAAFDPAAGGFHSEPAGGPVVLPWRRNLYRIRGPYCGFDRGQGHYRDSGPLRPGGGCGTDLHYCKLLSGDQKRTG